MKKILSSFVYLNANQSYISPIIKYVDSPFVVDGTVEQLQQILDRITDKKKRINTPTSQQVIIDAINKTIEKIKDLPICEERLGFKTFIKCLNEIKSKNNETYIINLVLNNPELIHSEQLNYLYFVAL